MTTAKRPARRHLIIEYALVLCIVAALGHVAWFFFTYGYLPQPFYYDPWGSLSDWFSLAQYGHRKGAYDIEMSIYPPISFVILKIFGNAACYANSYNVDVRYCDTVGLASIFGFYCLAVVLTFLHFRKFDRATYLPRAFAIAFGFPMLYALERGNLVTIAYCLFLLAYGPLIHSARLRWLCAGMVVNLKVYMIAAVLAPLAKRKWVAVEGALIATIAVYVVTWVILGEGNPFTILNNIIYFSSQMRGERLLDVWYASSLGPIRTLMTSDFPVYSAFSSRQVTAIYLFATGLTVLTQGLAVLAVAATFLRPEVVPNHRVVLFGTIVALATSEAGGYTGIFLIALIFMERWRGWARPAAMILAYIHSIPDDLVIPAGLPPLRIESFLGNQQVLTQYGIGAVSLLRPVLMFLACNCLAAVTIRDVWKDIREQGWQSRWRFRRDWPLLPAVRKPVAPAHSSSPSE